MQRTEDSAQVREKIHAGLSQKLLPADPNPLCEKMIKLKPKTKQIISWPIILIGFYFTIQFIAYPERENIFLYLLFIGFFIRTDFYNKKINNEFISKFKIIYMAGAIFIFLASMSLLFFTLLDYNNYIIIFYNPFIAYALGILLIILFLPYEIWYFKRHNIT